MLEFDGVFELTNSVIFTKNTVLDATGHRVTFNGANSVRVFQAGAGLEISLIHLIVANGRSTNGGALLSDGAIVHLSNCVFTNNAAVGLDGVDGPKLSFGNDPAKTAGAPGGDALGGAIFCSGTLEASNTLFVANAAIGGAGGTGGSVTGTAVFNPPIFPTSSMGGPARQRGTPEAVRFTPLKDRFSWSAARVG
jgi:hypothetical protein